MFTEIPVVKNVGLTQIKEVQSVIDLNSCIGKLSVSPIPREGCCLRAGESSICMVTSDVSGADLLSAFESISFDMHPEHGNGITKDHVQADAFDFVCEVDPFGRGSDGGKETSKVDLADCDSISDASNQRNDEAEILDEIDKNHQLNNPIIVYTSSRKSANNNKSIQSNEFHQTPKSDKSISNKILAVDISSLQILRRRRSLSSKRARPSVWGSLCNILPAFEESSGLNLNLNTKRKPRGATGVQRNRNGIRNQNGLKSITSSGRITLKIRIGSQSCVLGSATDIVNEPGKRIPELLVSTDKIEEQGPVGLVSHCERNLAKVPPADSSFLSTYPDLRDTLENPSCNRQIISQAEGDNSGAAAENRGSDPETSPDSEVINSVSDVLLSEEVLHMQGSPITTKACVSTGDISNFSSPHTKSKNGKKKNNRSSGLVDAKIEFLKSQVCETSVPCSHGKKISKCPGVKGGSKSSSTALDLPSKKERASKKKGNKNNLGGKHPVEVADANGVFGGVECRLVSGHQTSPHLGDIGVPNKDLSEAINSMQFSSSGERDPIVLLRNAWVLCDVCQKWRRIPSTLADKIEETNRGWTCKDNMDKDFADCSIPQEKSNSKINEELEISDAEEACDNFLTSNQNQPKAHQESSWSLIRSNLFLQRTRKKQTIDEVMVCHCKPPSDGRMGCGIKCLNRILNIECVKGTCPCGELCSNQQFQKRKYARLERFKCGKKGYGLQSIENIPEGQFLIEYVGEVLDMNAYEARQKEYAMNGHKHFYFMTLNGSEVIDACAKGNLGRFINHSCDPNCQTEKWMVNGEVCVGLFAIKDIKKGEEVTFDYNYVRVFGAAAKRCVCGSPSCRGYIGGDPKNSEIIVQEDSEDDYPEPAMICEDSELKSDGKDVMSDFLKLGEKEIEIELPGKGHGVKQVNAFSHLENVTEVHTSDILDQPFAGGCLKTSIAATVVGDKSEINCAAKAVRQSDMKQVIRESLNGSESATCMVQSEGLQSQVQSSSHFMDTPLQSVDIMKKLTTALLAQGSDSTSTVSPSKSLTIAVEHKTKIKYAAVEGRTEPAKSNSHVKTRRPLSSIKKGKIKSNIAKGKGSPDVDKLNEAVDKSKKEPELTINSQFEAVEGKLNDLLEPGGGISKRKDASKGYLKLLFLTAASGNNGHGGAIQSNRDLSMILDALLKTKSRTVLVDIIDKNGLQMLHNILKRYRKEFIKTPILRKLLKVLEYLAMREILTLEHITGGPPRPGVESFKDSILTLTEHADRQVHQIARNFRDRWIPRSHRRIEFHERSGYGGSSVSHDKWNDRSGKPSEAAILFEAQTRTSETSTIEHSSSANETKPRKRKSRWDNPDEQQHSILKTDLGSDAKPEIDDDIPPGFSIPCSGPTVPSNNSLTPITHQERNTCSINPRDIALGYSQQRFVSRMPISYGVPSSFMRQFGGFKTETSTGFTVAPGVPFYPFPPLPTHACEKTEQGSDNCTSRHAGNKHTRTWPTWEMDPPEENVPFANYRSDFQRGGSFDFGRKFRQQKFNHSKLAPPWVRTRNGWGYQGNNSKNGVGLGNGVNE